MSAGSLMQNVSGAREDGGEKKVPFPSLSQAVYARRREYVRPKRVRIKVGTWNVAARAGTEDDVGDWFVGDLGKVADDCSAAERVDLGTAKTRSGEDGRAAERRDLGAEKSTDEEMGLYVLGLQEVVDMSAVGEALSPFAHGESASAKKWKGALQKALPEGYVLVAEQQLIGLLLLIYASAAVVGDVQAVSTTSVGTGVWGYMGNKGAVSARLVLGDGTSLVFVNCHLAAGADKTALERRIWDVQQIEQRTQLEHISEAMDGEGHGGARIGDEDIAFWCGDLNFRLEGIPGEDVRRLLIAHTRNPHEGDGDAARRAKARGERVDEATSLQTTLDSLLPHDELRQQMTRGRLFHDGWREGPITFLPTYKYDTGSVGGFDSSEKKRAPSWCDRILFRTRRDKLAYDTQVCAEKQNGKGDEEMECGGIARAVAEADVLYDYDPDVDGTTGGEDDADDESDRSAATSVGATGWAEGGAEDEVVLECYTAHQRVVSSDHKPLHAVFLCTYEAVVAELKAQVHAECAKAWDQAENEGRPNVTIAVDRQTQEWSEGGCDLDAATPDRRSDEGVWFGRVRWMQAKQRTLTVANTSRVPASCRFIERAVVDVVGGGAVGEEANEGASAKIAPRWLTITVDGIPITAHSSISLQPGEAATITLELQITDMADVGHLHRARKPEVDEILVLRIENGRDHFIPIRGLWMASSLGRTMNTLVRIPEGGIRMLPGPKLKPRDEQQQQQQEEKGEGGEEEEEEKAPVRFSAPRELFRLTEAIEELSIRAVAEWEMTVTEGTLPSSSSLSSSAPSSTRPDHDIAEWAPPRAPWEAWPAWPFAAECATGRHTPEWEAALSSACNALDSNTPWEASWPAAFPRSERLYVLASLLLTFLASMPDGVIPAALWRSIESHLLEREKTSHLLEKEKTSHLLEREDLLEREKTSHILKSDNLLEREKTSHSLDREKTSCCPGPGPDAAAAHDALRNAVQDILAPEPRHAISLLLVTGMLGRVVGECVDSSWRCRSHAAVGRRKAWWKRMAMARWKGTGSSASSMQDTDDDGMGGRRQARALAEMMGPVLVRFPHGDDDDGRGGGRGKGWARDRDRERRRREVLEAFLGW